MSSITASFPGRLRLALSSPTRLIVGALAVLLLAVGGWQGWQVLRGPQLPGVPASVSDVEALYGIRIVHLAVLADGGIIDLRLQIIDADKAAPLFDLENHPTLIVEQTGTVVDSLYHPPHGHDLVAGQSTYLLYNDTGGVIKSGTPVSVILGNLRLEHIVAQ